MKKLATVSMSALMIALLVGLVATPASAQTLSSNSHYPPSDHHYPPSDHHSPPSDPLSAREADLRGQRHHDQPR